MIPLARGAEPAELRDARQGANGNNGELVRVRTIAANGAPTSEQIGDRYRLAAKALWRQQSFKCAYCEAREQLRRNDVEHFRPKGRITDEDGRHPVTPGYWWLAWTWENLLFSCRNCNQSPAKLDKFPLDGASTRLVAEQPPPGLERPLLLDPYDAAVDPMDHIRFRLARVRGQDRWSPYAHNGSRMGETSIAVLLLDRDDLLDLYVEHVKEHIEPVVADVLSAAGRADLPGVASAWQRACRMVAPRMPFAALSHDALDHFVPGATRHRWGLLLTRPQAQAG